MNDSVPVGLTDELGTVINPATEDTVAKLIPGSTPTIYNVTMTLANTEYSQAIPSGTKSITVQCRGLYDVKVAWVTAASAYLTIKSGFNYGEDRFNMTGATLYFQCGTAAQLLEIICYA